MANNEQLQQLQQELEALQKQLEESRKQDADAVAKQMQESTSRPLAKEVQKRMAFEAVGSQMEAVFSNMAERENARLQNEMNNAKDYKFGWEYSLRPESQMLHNAGYVLNRAEHKWEKPMTDNMSFDKRNSPEVNDDTVNADIYPMSEITDLVLVDSISYATNAGSGWDQFGEPQGSPLPIQRDGLKKSKEFADAVHLAVHSILNLGFSSNAATGNLFGLSVDDIGTAISTTDNDSASVLKYNYSGYGNPNDLKRNIFEDSTDIHSHTRFLGNLNATIAALSNT